MSNQDILKKVIEKAIRNGYSKDIKLDFEMLVEMELKKELEEIIFSHNFAKAFFGEENLCDRCKRTKGECKKVKCNQFDYAFNESWKYALQRLVLEEDKLKYLKKFL